jgi:hypothetical protein
MSGHVGSVVDKVALGQVFFEYFGFPCQSLLHHHHYLSSGADTIGQLVANVPSELSLASPQEKKNHMKSTSVHFITQSGISSQYICSRLR